jgi:hypothetical protein
MHIWVGLKTWNAFIPLDTEITSPTPCFIILEKLIVAQLVTVFSTVYGSEPEVRKRVG